MTGRRRRSQRGLCRPNHRAMGDAARGGYAHCPFGVATKTSLGPRPSHCKDSNLLRRERPFRERPARKRRREATMPVVKTKDGSEIFYKDSRIVRCSTLALEQIETRMTRMHAGRSGGATAPRAESSKAFSGTATRDASSGIPSGGPHQEFVRARCAWRYGLSRRPAAFIRVQIGSPPDRRARTTPQPNARARARDLTSTIDQANRNAR